jgi:sarcosine oxidase subunit delta
MLRIRCPWCGLRDEVEFRWGGEVPVARPAPPDEASDAAWGEYLFLRNNPKGWVRERWLHALGCRQWLIAERDTVTHEIRSSSPVPRAGRAAEAEA